jgi:hypothetical protein
MAPQTRLCVVEARTRSASHTALLAIVRRAVILLTSGGGKGPAPSRTLPSPQAALRGMIWSLQRSIEARVCAVNRTSSVRFRTLPPERLPHASSAMAFIASAPSARRGAWNSPTITLITKTTNPRRASSSTASWAGKTWKYPLGNSRHSRSKRRVRGQARSLPARRRAYQRRPQHALYQRIGIVHSFPLIGRLTKGKGGSNSRRRQRSK